ncbi:MAG: bifunctional methylenetetrahydrofolate dehydrogenase/methenyltetrahydrofolate cyclohydrolase FolD [Clostridia bacterium]|nr:bifunctional methylenetetrahydrofolate dehydrogenase/methenyltetrahydrofolate cyclohydrolase FolD [Clostridia bacterium]
MSANIIDGKKIAQQIKDELKIKIDKLENKPGLAVVQVGNDPASQVYVRNKEKACQKAGIYSKVIKLKEDISQQYLIDLIRQLNSDVKINGILVQLPLPEHIDSNKIINTIDVKKDVDGFSPISMGNVLIGRPGFISCTPRGIIRLIKSTGQKIEGKNAVVVGRSNIVGKPTATLLMRENATVTVCHSRTVDLVQHTSKADILVAATGKPGMIKGDMIKEGAIVIDVGISRVNGKLKGDVDFDSAKERAGWITPVPGGVGPMTIAMLLQNTLEAAYPNE